MAGQSWIKPLMMVALLLMAGAGRVGFTQSAEGSLTGKLTDLYSKPLGGATVIVRNQATGAEARTTASKNGVYRFNGLGPGEYTLEAESPRLGRGQVEGIVVTAGHEARVQAALELAPPKPTPNLTEAHASEPASTLAAARPETLQLARADRAVPPISGQISAPATAPVTTPATAQIAPHVREVPPVNSSEVNATLAGAPLVTLPLTAPASPHAARSMPETTTPRVHASLREERMHSLPLTARATETPQPQTPLSPALATTPPPPNPPPGTAPGTTPLEASLSAPRPPLALGLAGSGAGAGSPGGIAQALGGARGATAIAVGVVAAREAMKLGARPSRIQMTSASPGDPGTAALTTTLTAEQLQALPLTGRNWENFVLDAPPTAPEPGDEGQASLQSGDEAAAITVDGSSIRLAFGSTGTGRRSGRESSLIGPGASESAISEVQRVTGNVDASGDHVVGGRANVQTLRGIDGLHGQGSLFSRQNFWGAQNPFTQWVKETAPATLAGVPVFTAEPYTPSDRETTRDFGLGGRIGRRSIFWFAALDSHQRNNPGVSTVKHPDNFFAQPSNDQMQVLSARLGLSSSNPVAAGVAAYSTMLETLNGLLGPAPRTSTRWTGFGRIDWTAAERHNFTLEGTGADANAPGGGLGRTSETYGSHSYGSSHATEQWLLGRWETFLTPNLLLVTQGSLGRQIRTAPPETPSAYEQTLNINNWGRLPQMVVDSRYGFTIGNPARFGSGSYPDEHLYQAREQLSWVHGGLLLTAGFDVSHNRDATSMLRNQTGTYHYSSVENFASDALAFAAFGLNGQLNRFDQHNCDQTGRVWRDSAGTLHGLGYLPCYSYYTQTMGPANWWLSTNDWAGYVTTQWHPQKRLALSLAMRWELDQSPPPIPALANPDLPLAGKLPAMGNNWGPRVGLAWGSTEGRMPMLRLGYGMYFGRTPNATLLSALTRTGSLKGDLNFFMRPTDNLNAGGAPPFPYVLAGEPASVVKPAAAEFAPGFHNDEIHQAVAAVEETLPGHVRMEASAAISLGRRLPVTFDANIDPAVNPQTITYAVVDGNNSGPITARQITVPFFASWPSPTSSTGFSGRLNPNYQQITQIVSRANSTYEAATLRLMRTGRGGLTLNARYTYAHAMDWNPNESAQVNGPSVMDPTDFHAEYGTSNLDVRHSASIATIWEPRWRLGEWAGKIGNGWMLSSIGTFRSGLPYSMRTSGSLAREFDAAGAPIVALAPGMNGYGGDNLVYGVGRNSFRYPATWKADLRLAKNFKMGRMRQLEVLAESFNLFNHQNVTELETTGYTIESGSVNGSLPTLNFLTGLKTGQTEFGLPLNVNATNFYRQRQIQFGMRFRF